jgi:hypothetical protein
MGSRAVSTPAKRDDGRLHELLDEYGRVLASAREEFTAAHDRLTVLAKVAEQDADREAEAG